MTLQPHYTSVVGHEEMRMPYFEHARQLMPRAGPVDATRRTSYNAAAAFFNHARSRCHRLRAAASRTNSALVF